MNFLVKKSFFYGPNHGVLCSVLDKAYKGPTPGVMDRIDNLTQLTEFISGDKLNELYGDVENSSVRRYLALSLDWGNEGAFTQQAWSDFAHEALTQNSINGKKLADDVDVILMISHQAHPAIFQRFEPSTTVLIDFSEMDYDSAVEYFTKAIVDFHPATPMPSTPKNRRDEEIPNLNF